MIVFLIILVFIYKLLIAIRNLILTYNRRAKAESRRYHLVLAMSTLKYRYRRAQHKSNHINSSKHVDFVCHFIRSEKVSAQSFILHINMHLKVTSRKRICKTDIKMMWFHMSPTAAESNVNWLRLKQKVAMEAISFFSSI